MTQSNNMRDMKNNDMTDRMLKKFEVGKAWVIRSDNNNTTFLVICFTGKMVIKGDGKVTRNVSTKFKLG